MANSQQHFELARVYATPERDGRFRVLVDRLWPRGIKKTDLHLDAWMKELGPTSELRRWFNHDPARWQEFRTRFFKELEAKTDQVQELRQIAERQPVLLLYAARDEQHNNAVALKEFLEMRAD